MPDMIFGMTHKAAMYALELPNVLIAQMTVRVPMVEDVPRVVLSVNCTEYTIMRRDMTCKSILRRIRRLSSSETWL